MSSSSSTTSSRPSMSCGWLPLTGCSSSHRRSPRHWSSALPSSRDRSRCRMGCIGTTVVECSSKGTNVVIPCAELAAYSPLSALPLSLLLVSSSPLSQLSFGGRQLFQRMSTIEGVPLQEQQCSQRCSRQRRRELHAGQSMNALRRRPMGHGGTPRSML